MATHSSTLAWKIPWPEEPGRLQSMGSLRVGQDWATSLSLFTFTHWRRKRNKGPSSQGYGLSCGHVWMWQLDCEESWAPKNWCFWTVVLEGIGEDSWESLGLQGDPTSSFWRSALGFLWKEWCWSWNSSTLATSWEELTHWKRLWCWEGLGAGGEGDDRGWDGWMASLTRWMWVWVNSGSWWWTGRPGVLRFMGSQRVGHDWATELNWTELIWTISSNFTVGYISKGN